jgi:hypothetical protein
MNVSPMQTRLMLFKGNSRIFLIGKLRAINVARKKKEITEIS